MAKDMKKIFEQMASVATKALMPVALAAALAPAAQAQDEGETPSPFVPNNSDISFQPSLIGTVLFNRANVVPSLAHTQFIFSNDAFLSGGLGVHAKIEESVFKRVDLGYEFAKGRHFGFVSVPLKQQKQGAWVTSRSHFAMTLDAGVFAMSNPDGNGTYGAFLQPGVKFRGYFSNQIGIEAGFNIRALGGVGGEEPVLHLKPAASIGVVWVPKR